MLLLLTIHYLFIFKINLANTCSLWLRFSQGMAFKAFFESSRLALSYFHLGLMVMGGVLHLYLMIMGK